MKLFLLLYADDAVVFGTDEKEFQKNLDTFFEYSELLHLNINYEKKILFGTLRDLYFDFNLDGHKTDICTYFKYIGVIFSGHFHQARKHNVEQAKKAMIVLFKRIRNLNIPNDLQLHLFDLLILPKAFYGCEIWSFENSQIVEICIMIF